MMQQNQDIDALLLEEAGARRESVPPPSSALVARILGDAERILRAEESEEADVPSIGALLFLLFGRGWLRPLAALGAPALVGLTVGLVAPDLIGGAGSRDEPLDLAALLWSVDVERAWGGINAE